MIITPDALQVTLSQEHRFFWNVDLARLYGILRSLELDYIGYASLMSYPWTAHFDALFDACPSLFSAVYNTRLCH